jgi:hypothetical protein
MSFMESNLRRSSLLVCLLAALALPLAAQTDEGVDREDGEEDQVEEREKWFRERRQLDVTEGADKLRAAAATATLRQQAGRGGAAWEALGPSPMTMLGWTMGNVAGRITAIAVHPTDDLILYIGSAAGGVWKTIDGGASWTPVFDQVGTQSIGSIRFDPFDSETVWVGTGELHAGCGYFGMGLFRSQDGGASWEARNGTVGTALDLSFVSAITIFENSLKQKTLLVGGKGDCLPSGGQSPGGLFRSHDDGATWTKVFTGTVWDVVVGRTKPQHLFMTGWLSGIGAGVFRSVDGGAIWTPLNTGSPTPFEPGGARAHLTRVAADGSNAMYAFLPQRSAGSLYRSVDGGVNWTLPATGACEGQCSYNATIAVRPDLGSTLLIGSIRIARSTNSGSAPAALTNTWGSSQQVHQDTHVLTYSESTPGRFWVGSDGGIWRSDNDGNSFVNLNANLGITQFYDIAVHPDNPEIVFGGAQDNSSSRRTSGNLWQVSLASGDGFVNIVDLNPTITFQSSYPSGGLPNTARSASSGNPNSYAWMAKNGLVQGEPYPWVTPLAGSHQDGAGHIFLGSHSVYRAATSQNAGSFTWTKISPRISTGSLESIAAASCAGKMRVFGLGGGGEVQRTDDALAGAGSWTVVDEVPTSNVTTDIAVSEKGCGQEVYVSVGTFLNPRLYRSLSGGDDWAAVGEGLPAVPANTVAVDPATGDVYVGTDLGVYRSTDQGANFSPFWTGLPLGVPVTDLELDDSPNYLHAATYGRGAYRTNLADIGLFADGFESGDTLAWTSTVPAP